MCPYFTCRLLEPKKVEEKTKGEDTFCIVLVIKFNHVVLVLVLILNVFPFVEKKDDAQVGM